MLDLRVALQAVGADPADVANTTVYMARGVAADLLATSRVVHHHPGELEPPSTLLDVTVLGYPDQLTEVEAVAVLAGSSAVLPRPTTSVRPGPAPDANPRLPAQRPARAFSA